MLLPLFSHHISVASQTECRDDGASPHKTSIEGVSEAPATSTIRGRPFIRPSAASGGERRQLPAIVIPAAGVAATRPTQPDRRPGQGHVTAADARPVIGSPPESCLLNDSFSACQWIGQLWAAGHMKGNVSGHANEHITAVICIDSCWQSIDHRVK